MSEYKKLVLKALEVFDDHVLPNICKPDEYEENYRGIIENPYEFLKEYYEYEVEFYKEQYAENRDKDSDSEVLLEMAESDLHNFLDDYKPEPLKENQNGRN